MFANKQDFLPELPQDKKSRFILLLIFLFPLLVATVKGASSLLLLLLLVVSFGNFSNNWQKLQRMEQAVLMGMVVLVSTVALSLLISEDIRQGASLLERYVRLVLIIPIYFTLRVKNIDSAKALLWGAFIACFSMAVQAFFEVEIQNHDIVYGAYHRIVYGNMVVLYISLVVAAGLWLLPKGKSSFVLLAAIMAGIYAVLLSGSRSALLFIPMVLVVGVFLYRKRLSKKSWLFITGTLVLMTMVLGTQHTKLLDGLTRGLENIEKYQQDNSVYTSWGARLNMWYNSWQIYKSSPVLGAGVGGYHAEVQKLLHQGIARQDGFSENQANTHSIYFQTLAEGGTVGIIILLGSLFILPVMFFHRHWKTGLANDVMCYSLAGIIVVLAFAWFGVSEGWLNRNPMVNSYILLLAVFMSSIANKVNPIENNIA